MTTVITRYSDGGWTSFDGDKVVSGSRFNRRAHSEHVGRSYAEKHSLLYEVWAADNTVKDSTDYSVKAKREAPAGLGIFLQLGQFVAGIFT